MTEAVGQLFGSLLVQEVGHPALRMGRARQHQLAAPAFVKGQPDYGLAPLPEAPTEGDVAAVRQLNLTGMALSVSARNCDFYTQAEV